MAQPGPYVDVTSYQAGRTFLDLRWTSGSTGAVATVDPAKKYGFDTTTPVAHGSTGVYTVTLAEHWADFISAKGDVIQASYSKTGACFVRATAYSLANKTITLLVVDAAGDATDPTTGDVITVTVTNQTYTNV